MATETIRVKTNEDYSDSIKHIEQVRDCVEGSPRIKKKTTDYLPHPSQVDTTSKRAIARYNDYILNAEFDNDTDDTRRELIGKMRLDDITAETASKLEYMLGNMDGDGTTVKSFAESIINDVLQVKFKFWVVDYQGLSGVDLESISIADAKLLNPRAVAKLYTRENIVNWNFTRINGVMQLSFVMLLERGQVFDNETYTTQEVQSYLILALDDNGKYYQQKIVYGADGQGQLGERDYQLVNGSALTFIPADIIADEEVEPGTLPRAMGYLYGISDKVLYRYRTSALYKECQKALLPTTYTKGWKSGDKELFTEINGRDNIESGGYSMNGLPRDVSVDVVSASAEMTDFQWYFDQSRKQVAEMGGKSGAEASNMTATEANIVASSQNALLDTIATSVENGLEKLLSYCAMFEGLVSPDAVHAYEDVNVSLPRDFATPKMQVDEVKVLLELYTNGMRTRDQVAKQLADGGWDIQDAETTIQELESDGGNLMLPPIEV